MTEIVTTAMSGVTTVFQFIMANVELAVVALGFPVVRGAVRVVKRLIRV